MRLSAPLRLSALAAAAAAALPAGPAAAQFTTPNTTTGHGSASVVVGNLRFTNQGLQGVGRVSASALDPFGETFGSVSGLQIGNWAAAGHGSYSGTFYTLPDRGYNAAPVFSDYAGRIQTLDFSFTPYTGRASIGGTTEAEKLAAQNQIKIDFATDYRGATRFTYATDNGLSVSTGLDPLPGSAGTTALFGQQVPYAKTQLINGQAWRVDKLSLDSEALVLKSDGSGYIGDEYGPNIYYFDGSKKIIGAVALPEALKPYGGTGVPGAELNFNSSNPPLEGRRNNQGMEGLALSPDGRKLYGLMQSATVQDSTAANQASRLNTRLVVYDVGAPGADGMPVHTLSEEYVLQLPTFRRSGDGGAVDRTAAQSEIVALGDGKLLVLARDGNGLGSNADAQAMFKSVLLVDTKGATDIAGGGYDAKGAAVAPGGVLAAGVTPLSWGEAVNLLNTTQLAKFNFNLDNANVDRLTLSEKWEGMALVSALDPARPNDYFLFVANDNDFLTRTGVMSQADGTKFAYDASTGYAPNLYADNDTVFLAYRVTIGAVPEPGPIALLASGLAIVGWLGRRRRQRPA